jgi:brefeldin A-resistance guanine nucleotide exchange factor 1
MLTTNLHNPNVKPKDRMTKQQFLRTNCGINAGGNLPGDFIAATYDAIGAKPV